MAYYSTEIKDGEPLTLTIIDASGKTVVDWKGTTEYHTVSVDEGTGCEPARCQAYSVDVPGS